MKISMALKVFKDYQKANSSSRNFLLTALPRGPAVTAAAPRHIDRLRKSRRVFRIVLIFALSVKDMLSRIKFWTFPEDIEIKTLAHPHTIGQLRQYYVYRRP